MNGKSYLRIDEVADKLQVTERTVRRWIRKGSLVAFHYGQIVRISREDFEHFKRSYMNGNFRNHKEKDPK